jgi:hypothetical protein
MNTFASRTAIALAWLAASAGAHAATFTFSGKLDDADNAALHSSDLSTPSFADVYAVANNVALYRFDVTTAGTVVFKTSDGAAGVDPYFSLFKGVSNAATFVDSNYFLPHGDFTMSMTLAAGSYTLALGAFDNMSFAENYGSGTLADGFIGLGEPDAVGNASYSIQVTTPVPEPATAALLLAGAMACGLLSRARKL